MGSSWGIYIPTPLPSIPGLPSLVVGLAWKRAMSGKTKTKMILHNIIA